jgi:hypothetical protein
MHQQRRESVANEPLTEGFPVFRGYFILHDLVKIPVRLQIDRSRKDSRGQNA